MIRKATLRWMSLLMTLVMVIGMLPPSTFAEGSVTNYDDFLTNLKQLEVYADEHAAQKILQIRMLRRFLLVRILLA